jgi:uncharacterized protein
VTPLSEAVRNGLVEKTKLLLANGAKKTINTIDKLGHTALWHGLKNTSLVKILTDAGADPNLGCDVDSHDTIFTWAPWFANEESMKLLLEAGADVKRKNKFGRDALMHATTNSKMGIVKVLINAHANVNEIDNDGETALIKASQEGDKEIVGLLIDAGANVTHKDNRGWDASAWAARNRHLYVYDTLQEVKCIEWQKKRLLPSGKEIDLTK